MGCSAAKNIVVEPADDNKITELTSNGHPNLRKISVTHSPAHVPPIESEEPQLEMLENSHASVNNFQKGVNGLSFEINFEEEGEESIINKHPPKRFQKLEDEQTSPFLTLSKLQEKLEETDIRRQQILQQRVQSAKLRNQLKKQGSLASMSSTLAENGHDLEDTYYLRIPEVNTPRPPNPYDVSYT